MKAKEKINTVTTFQVIEKNQMKKIVGGDTVVRTDQTKLDGVLNLIR